jgi:rfaE bifunctional protein nucleotidyltransferase chain/domain/rfaE bifunctional protein kinase chain/domain
MARLVVVGEAMLDVDLEGRAGRLSPEAPVPVLDDVTERDRPGGAALAAAMLARDGHRVTLLTPLADDRAGGRVRSLLAETGVDVVALPQQGATPVKRRVRASGQNIVRLDEGGSAGPWRDVPPGAREALGAAEAVLVADYGRGLTADPQCRTVLADVATRVPLVWDPHPRGADPVPGTVLCTPNEAELHGRVGRAAEAGLRGVARAAALLAERLGPTAVAVTLGSRGAMLVLDDGPPQVFAARPARGDPCGAGDRFASAAVGALTGGALVSDAVQAAVLAATEHVASGGAAAFGDDPAPATDGAGPEDVARRVRAAGGTVVATGGCFDLLHAGHVAMLESARALGDCLVVCLNSDASIRRLKGPGRPLQPAADRARVLCSLGFVDAVLVFEEDTPTAAIERLRPDVWVKGGDYAGRRLPEEEVLERWGGQAVVVPYLPGRSTTGLVRAMTTTP